MGQLEQEVTAGHLWATSGTPGCVGAGNPIVLSPAPTIVTFALCFLHFTLHGSTTFPLHYSMLHISTKFTLFRFNHRILYSKF